MPLLSPGPVRCAARRVIVFAVMGVAALAGCKPTEGVTKYTAPHELSAGEDIEPDPPEAVADGVRIVGLIGEAAPENGDPQWWFFKMRGSPKAVGKRLKGFETFAASLRLPEGDDKIPTFQLPDGWQVGPRSNQFALISIRTGSTFTPLNVDISRAGGGFADNLNRWHDQVGLARVSDAEAKTGLREVKTADGKKLFWVDIAGPGGAKMPPFAKP